MKAVSRIRGRGTGVVMQARASARIGRERRRRQQPLPHPIGGRERPLRAAVTGIKLCRLHSGNDRMINRIKNGIQGLLRRLGYQLMRIPVLSASGTRTYEEIRPWATYAPWNADSDFIATYNAIKSHTLVDLYRCWELWTLVA